MSVCSSLSLLTASVMELEKLEQAGLALVLALVSAPQYVTSVLTWLTPAEPLG